MSLQLQIDKLKGLDNYKAWAMTVRAYMEVEDLWNVVENGPDGSDEVCFCFKRIFVVIKFWFVCRVFKKINVPNL